MRWEQGRQTVEGMIGRGELGRVPASRPQAEAMIDQARKHVTAARLTMDVDPVGSYQLLYDAARKALCGVLENQGLRTTVRGGHIAVFEAVSAQLDPPLGPILRPFDRMRRRRNEAEYPQRDTERFGPDDVRRDLPKVESIIDLSVKVIDQMRPF
ncbi:hypothetical protein [Herbidospora sp. RD11066]